MNSLQQSFALANQGKSVKDILAWFGANNDDEQPSQDYLFRLGAHFSRANRLDESIACMKSAMRFYPDQSDLAMTVLTALERGWQQIGSHRFVLNHPAMSGYVRYMLARGDAAGYETQEMQLMLNNINEHDRVLELGCGIGFVGIHCKAKAPACHYVSFEANPDLLPLIRDNQAKNGVTFDVVNAVLGNKTGRAKFYQHRDFWSSSLVPIEQAVGEVEVPVFSINEHLNRRDINFLLMDIEGGELDLVPAIDWRRINKIVIEVHPKVYGVEGAKQVLNHLQSSGLAVDAQQSKGDVFFLSRGQA